VKKIYLLIIFCFIAISEVYCQFFGLIQKVPQQHYWLPLDYPQDSKYRALNCIQWSTANSYFYRRCQVLIYNNLFQLTDSVNLMNGVIPWQSAPIKRGNRLFWAAHAFDTIAPDAKTNQLVILELDTNYNHVGLHKVTNLKYFSNGAPTTTNLIFMSGRFYVNHTDIYQNQSTIYKLTTQFVKVDSATYNGTLHSIKSIDNKLVLNVEQFPLPCADLFGARLERLVMDTNYNFISCFTFTSLGYHNYGPFPQSIEIVNFGPTSLIPISKTKTFAAGMMGVFHTLTPPILEKKGLVNCIIANDNAVIKASVYSNTVSNMGYCSGSNAIAIKGNQIITAGTVGFDLQQMLMTQTENNKIFVNKIDTLGNLIWLKQYGGDSFYAPTGIAFTSDGGCLISGFRYPKKVGTQIPSVEGFLLKLDANGDYAADVGIVENGNTNTTIKCYPNPSADQVFFDIPFQDKINIVVYSALGAEVLNTKDYKNRSAINVSGLEKGIYFYKVKTTTNNYSGKFLKE
jgi:hypothetical protein